MAYEDEIHIPQNRRDEASARRIGRRALDAIQQIIREEAGVSNRDTRPVCLGCSANVATAAAMVADEEDRANRRSFAPIPPMEVESFLRSLLREEARV